MRIEEKNRKTIRIILDSDLHELLKNEAERLDIDFASYVRWCIRTGVYLKDLNRFIRLKRGKTILN
ncbi:MAG: hypothetical protein JSV09_06365 [Thermoplasmata archaeon]|nr:MAG: hypothetical protein JSV09_06365 [Thermoplasmata archaeon]